MINFKILVFLWLDLVMYLNSSGSVIPLFKKQIKNLSPITITHPEVNSLFYDY